MFNDIFIGIFILSILTIGTILESGLSTVSSLKIQRIKFPFITFYLLLFYHDYLFLNLEMIFGLTGGRIAAAWKEMILLMLLLSLIAIKLFSKHNKFLLASVLFLFALIIQGMITSIFVFNDSISTTLLGSKEYIFPILIIVLLFYFPSVKNSIKVNCNIVFWFVLFPNFIFGLWQFFNVVEMSDIWFFDIFTRKGFELEEYNYFREGRFRTTGFFVGTLEYGATAAILFMAFFSLKGEQLSFFKMFVLMIMILMSQSRTFLIGIVLFIFLYYTLFVIKNFYRRMFFSFISVLVAFLVILYIVFISSNDLSALSRIVQWTNAVQSLINYPFGIGYARVGIGKEVWPDSQVIAYIYIFGVTSVSIVMGMIFLAVKSSYLYNETFMDSAKFPPVALLVFLFFILFQSLENTSIFIFLVFLVIQNVKEVRNVNAI